MSDTPSTDKTTTPPRTIDEAIEACNKNIFWHRLFAILILALLVFSSVFYYKAIKSQELTMQLIIDEFNAGRLKDTPESIQELHDSKTRTYFLMAALFIITFGIVVSVYRFHLTEIARNEQMKVGFWRIRIAANNTDKGFQSEVRQALTKDAFSYDRTKKVKEKELESPVPGHPGSDIATALMNKIVEKIEISFPDKK